MIRSTRTRKQGRIISWGLDKYLEIRAHVFTVINKYTEE